DLAKELLKQVANFTGDGTTPQPLLKFIDKVDAYLQNANLTQLQKCEIVASKLTSTAHTWWMSNIYKAWPKTWLQLKTALLQRFTPPAFVTTVLKKLDAISQTDSVVKYINAFNKLAMQLAPDAITAVGLCHQYCKGLKRPIYTAIINQPHQALNALQASAIAQEQMTTA
ncbi:hypothetical protein HDU89_000968, partial [Geranomyces variabilis]